MVTNNSRSVVIPSQLSIPKETSRKNSDPAWLFAHPWSVIMVEGILGGSTRTRGSERAQIKEVLFQEGRHNDKGNKELGLSTLFNSKGSSECCLIKQR